MKASDQSLYRRVVQVTHIYLGPAAERFIDRQVQNHLQKEPEKLSKEDLLALIDWIKISVSLLTEDSQIIEEYTTHLRQLAGSKGTSNSSRNVEE